MKPKKGQSFSRRRLNRCERILKAIAFARRRFADDWEFIAQVNAILANERVVPKEDFGVYDRKGKDRD